MAAAMANDGDARVLAAADLEGERGEASEGERDEWMEGAQGEGLGADLILSHLPSSRWRPETARARADQGGGDTGRRRTGSR